jgi:hypothetical protein
MNEKTPMIVVSDTITNPDDGNKYILVATHPDILVTTLAKPTPTAPNTIPYELIYLGQLRSNRQTFGLDLRSFNDSLPTTKPSTTNPGETEPIEKALMDTMWARWTLQQLAKILDKIYHIQMDPDYIVTQKAVIDDPAFRLMQEYTTVLQLNDALQSLRAGNN